jgi:hypothetical protein
MIEGWVDVIRSHIRGQELVNVISACVSDRAGRGHEVAALVRDDVGDWLLVFRPQVRTTTHVTATVVGRDGYPR